MACELMDIKDEVNDVSEEEVFENYGVFQSDYEFKFVQEGTDKTTLMLPTVTYDSMDVKYFNIEIEVDDVLYVENLEVENTDRKTVKYCLKIAKHRPIHGSKSSTEKVAQPSGKANQFSEKMPKASIDVHNYSKSKVVTNPPAEGDEPVVKLVQIFGNDGKSETVYVKTKDEALDGTELPNEIDPNDESVDGYLQVGDADDMEDGDDDDDLGDFDESDISSITMSGSNLSVGGTPDTERKTRRKYERTNNYSRKESEQFTMEKNEAGDKWFQCIKCQYSSKWMGNMRDHVRIHTGERPFVCNVCDKAFTNQSSYNNHIIIHSDARPHMCKICGFAFKVRRQLVKHELRHTTSGQYKCQFCDRHYYTNTELKNHMPVHTRERNHKCAVCFKTFTSVSSLSRHKLIHTGGNYQCHLCGGVFMRKEYWRKHMMRSHDYEEDDALLSKRVRYTNSEPDGQAELLHVGEEREEVIKVNTAGTLKTEDVGTSMEVQGEEEGEVQYIISLSY